MQGIAVGTALAQDGDKLFIDNKGVTACAAVALTPQVAHMDLRHIVYNNLGTRPLTSSGFLAIVKSLKSASWLQWPPIRLCRIMTQQTRGTLP